jgi:hypothetical protein
LVRDGGGAYVAPPKVSDPERDLMMAVLEDAIECLSKSRFVKNGPRRRIFEQEKRWFLDEDTCWPYSFGCICETLDLDSNAVRESLGLVSGAPAFRDDLGRRRPHLAEAFAKRTDSATM